MGSGVALGRLVVTEVAVKADVAVGADVTLILGVGRVGEAIGEAISGFGGRPAGAVVGTGLGGRAVSVGTGLGEKRSAVGEEEPAAVSGEGVAGTMVLSVADSAATTRSAGAEVLVGEARSGSAGGPATSVGSGIREEIGVGGTAEQPLLNNTRAAIAAAISQPFIRLEYAPLTITVLKLPTHS